MVANDPPAGNGLDTNQLMFKIERLLQQTGPGHNTITAYDTAWVARLTEILPEIAKKAIKWLRRNQLADGSWGMELPVCYHDRVLCTLSAAIALHRNNDKQDINRVSRGLIVFQDHIKMLDHDLAGPTAGFEMLLPVLIEEATQIGLSLPIEENLLAELHRVRNKKLASIPNGMVSRHVTMAFSAEMAGSDGEEILDIENLLEENGSVALSPSATAYYLLNIRPDDKKALNYIKRVSRNGHGAPNFAPFDIYEKAWVLWNLSHVDLQQRPEIEKLVTPLLESLYSCWELGKGVGFSSSFSPRDADDTAIVFEILSYYGYKPPVEDLLRYEGEEHFRCFDFETHPSTGANIHMLGSLYSAGFTKYDRPVQKILNYLSKSRIDGCKWTDKWHFSPYYITSHAIIMFSRYGIDLGQDSVDWMIESQKEDGSWGYQFSTAEETAYCLQALVAWQQAGYDVPIETILRGYKWLKDHADQPVPPLWTAKCLYSPVLVVQSTILSALLMVEQSILTLDSAEYEHGECSF